MDRIISCMSGHQEYTLTGGKFLPSIHVYFFIRSSLIHHEQEKAKPRIMYQAMAHCLDLHYWISEPAELCYMRDGRPVELDVEDVLKTFSRIGVLHEANATNTRPITPPADIV